MPTVSVYVKSIDTREVVRTIKVKDTSAWKLEKLLRGLLLYMDTDRFFVDDEAYKALKKKAKKKVKK